MPERRAELVCAALLLVVSACSDGGSDQQGLGSLRIVSGSGQTDTSVILLAEPLVVEVKSVNGEPAAGIVVHVGPAQCLPGCALPWSEDDHFPHFEMDFETDARGRATIPIFLGTPAGDAALPIEVPSLELTDTALYHVQPGHPVGVSILPQDTAVYAGAGYELHAALVDQWSSPYPDPVAYVAEAPLVATVSAAGAVKALAIGRGTVTATAGGFTEVAHVSVVPEGTVTVASFSTTSQVYVINLDGTGRRFLAETGVLYGGASSWSPDGRTIVFHYSTNGGTHLRRISSAGGTDTPFFQGALPFEESSYPQFSPDGGWVYFQGYTFSAVNGEIWRAHPDGSVLERVGPPGGPTSTDAYPTPSPDGTRVAFTSDRGHEGTPTLRILTLADSSEIDVALDGTFPSWSPSGDWIALQRYDPEVAQGAIWLVHPDGTEAHRISPAEVRFNDFGTGWSPDGQWVIATAGFGTLLLGLDGTALPLHFPADAVYPAWKPAP